MDTSTSGVGPPVEELKLPDLGGFSESMTFFLRTVAGVARRRADASGVERLGSLAHLAVSDLGAMLEDPETRDALGSELEDASNRTALAILAEEMDFYAWQHRGSVEGLEYDMPDLSDQFGAATANPLSKEAVDDASTIVGSIEKVLDKLPRPLKKLMHVLLEVLKLTRGG